MKRGDFQKLIEALGHDPRHVSRVLIDATTGVHITEVMWDDEHDAPVLVTKPNGERDVAEFTTTKEWGED